MTSNQTEKTRLANRPDRSFYQLVAKLAVPVVLQNLITIGVNMMDTIMLGSYGEIQLSASSLANDFISIFHILCMGIGGGAAVLTAQYWGAEDVASLKKAMTIMLRFCMAIALVFTLVTFLFPMQIMSIYTPDAAIIEKGVLYFRISAVTYILMGLSLTLSIILRSVRLTRVPLIMAVIAFFVNIFFNWVFIFGNLGAPEMQIEGAALGTVIARFVEALIIVVYVFVIDQRVQYRVRDLFAACGSHIRVYFKYSVPVILSDALLALGNSAVAIIGGRIGAAFVAGNAIVSLTVRMSTVFNQGVSNASGIITGNTLGRGDKDLAYRQGTALIRISLLAGLLAAGIILLCCPPIINAYNITQETREVAFQLMYAVSFMVVFQALQGVLTKGVLRGGGDTIFLLIADVLFLWLASVPLGYFAGLVWRLPPFWVYIALKIDWVIKSLWCLGRFRSKKWMKVVERDIPHQPTSEGTEAI